MDAANSARSQRTTNPSTQNPETILDNSPILSTKNMNPNYSHYPQSYIINTIGHHQQRSELNRSPFTLIYESARSFIFDSTSANEHVPISTVTSFDMVLPQHATRLATNVRTSNYSSLSASEIISQITANSSMIRRLFDDHTSEEDTEESMRIQSTTPIVRENAHKRTIFGAWNFGTPNHVCIHCGAILWYEERIVKSRKPLQPKFSICCSQRKVKLPFLKETPLFLKELLDYNGGQRSKLFRGNIRAYNSMFAFTSTEGVVDNEINDGNGPYVYCINGQNHHKIGTLIPKEGQLPKFAQLYIYDIEHEVSNRLRVMSSGKSQSGINTAVVNGLLRMLDEYNPLVKVFRMARDRFKESDYHPVKINLLEKRKINGAQYNLPSASEVAALIVGDGSQPSGDRDIVVEEHGVGLRRIQEIHPSFMAMQYPILFPYGEDFYRTDIEYKDADEPSLKKKKVCHL
ncbi:hypothetical protein REPUB_Repub06bG0207000 [Reevesia pubescens]